MSANSKRVRESITFLNSMNEARICELLVEHGLKGRPRTTSRCPVALLLQEVFGQDFRVGKEFIIRINRHGQDRFPTPPHIVRFIERFDAGRWPELIAPPPNQKNAIRRRGHTARRVKHRPSQECKR